MQILDDFIHKSRSGAIEMYGDMPAVAHCILQSEDTSVVTRASRYPMRPFVSPFLDKSVEQILDIFVDKIRGPGHTFQPTFAYFVFTILDEQMAKDGSTCLLVCNSFREKRESEEDEISQESKASYRSVRTEFANSLYHAAKLEDETETLLELKADNDDADLIKWETEVTSADPESWERLPVDGAS